MHDRAAGAAERVRRKGSENGGAPTGKGTKEGTFRGMDGRNKMSLMAIIMESNM